MDGFELERDLEEAGIDAFAFSLMDDVERRQVLENAHLDPAAYEDEDLRDSFDAWDRLQEAGLSLRLLASLDRVERRRCLRAAGLDPDDYERPAAFSADAASRAGRDPEADRFRMLIVIIVLLLIVIAVVFIGVILKPSGLRIGRFH